MFVPYEDIGKGLHCWGLDHQESLETAVAGIKTDQKIMCVLISMHKEISKLRRDLSQSKKSKPVSSHPSHPVSDGAIQWMNKPEQKPDPLVRSLGLHFLKIRERKAILNFKHVSEVTMESLIEINGCGCVTADGVMNWLEEQGVK